MCIWFDVPSRFCDPSIFSNFIFTHKWFLSGLFCGNWRKHWDCMSRLMGVEAWNRNPIDRGDQRTKSHPENGWCLSDLHWRWILESLPNLTWIWKGRSGGGGEGSKWCCYKGFSASPELRGDVMVDEPFWQIWDPKRRRMKRNLECMLYILLIVPLRWCDDLILHWQWSLFGQGLFDCFREIWKTQFIGFSCGQLWFRDGYLAYHCFLEFLKDILRETTPLFLELSFGNQKWSFYLKAVCTI